MSKSIGNIAPLSDVLDRWPAEVVIAYFLTSHYRSRLPFSEERLDDARAVVERLANTLRSLDRAIAGDQRGPRPGPVAHDRRRPRRVLPRPGRRLRHPRGLRGAVRDGPGRQPGHRRRHRGRRTAARGPPRAGRAARHHRPRRDRPRSAGRGARRGDGPAYAGARRRARPATSPAPTPCATGCASWATRSPTPPRVRGSTRHERRPHAPGRARGGLRAQPGARAAGGRGAGGPRVYALPQLAGEPWLEGVAVTENSRDQLGRLAGTSDHQGVVAVADPYPYAEPGDVLERPGPVVCLDGAQDPRNLGAIARVAEGVGAAGMIIPRRGSPGITPDRRQGVGRGGGAPGDRAGREHGELPPRRAGRRPPDRHRGASGGRGGLPRAPRGPATCCS